VTTGPCHYPEDFKETLKIHRKNQKHKGIVMKGLTCRNMTQAKDLETWLKAMNPVTIF
jgi:hypothetical protein